MLINTVPVKKYMEPEKRISGAIGLRKIVISNEHGSATFKENGFGIFDLLDIEVKEKSRGHGTRLLTKAEEILSDMGAFAINTHADESRTKGVSKFYKASGFTEAPLSDALRNLGLHPYFKRI